MMKKTLGLLASSKVVCFSPSKFGSPAPLTSLFPTLDSRESPCSSHFFVKRNNAPKVEYVYIQDKSKYCKYIQMYKKPVLP